MATESPSIKIKFKLWRLCSRRLKSVFTRKHPSVGVVKHSFTAKHSGVGRVFCYGQCFQKVGQIAAVVFNISSCWKAVFLFFRPSEQGKLNSYHFR